MFASSTLAKMLQLNPFRYLIAVIFLTATQASPHKLSSSPQVMHINLAQRPVGSHDISAKTTDSTPTAASPLPYPPASSCSLELDPSSIAALSHTSSTHCSIGSLASLTCFGGICIGGPISVSGSTLSLACHPDTPHTGSASPILGTYVQSPNLLPLQSSLPRPQQLSILVAREAEDVLDPWKAFQHAWSLVSTILALRAANDSETGRPFLTIGDAERTQVVLLDGHPIGPFAELWRIVSTKPVARWNTTTSLEKTATVVKAIDGSTAILPMIVQHHKPQSLCISEKVAALGEFAIDVLARYQRLDTMAAQQHSLDPRLRLTILASTLSRPQHHLLDNTFLITTLRDRFPFLHINTLDPYDSREGIKKQLLTMRSTDILISIGGSGMAHSLFLRQGSALINVHIGVKDDGDSSDETTMPRHVAQSKGLQTYDMRGSLVSGPWYSGSEAGMGGMYVEEQRLSAVVVQALERLSSRREV